MKPWQLYAVIRGQWKMNRKNAEKFQYAFACDAGLVVEIYEIESWHACNETMTDDEKSYRKSLGLFNGEEGRIEFTGKVAPEEIRKQYKNTNVFTYLGKTQKEFK